MIRISFCTCVICLIMGFHFGQGARVQEASNTTTWLTLNRTKRATSNVLSWRIIYSFTIKLSKIAGDDVLLKNLIQMISTKTGDVSKASIYGYYGYSVPYAYVAARPIIYYVPVQTQQYALVPISTINGLTSNFGNTVSNSELLEQLIQLIQQALDESYDSTDSA